MNDLQARPSPGWYRNRGSVIGAMFGAGFLIGNLRVDGSTALPAAIVWGGSDAGAHALLWAGVALTLLAWLLRLAGTAYLRGDVVFAPNVQRDRLIVAGIFRYVRNPLYLGNDFLALGIGLFAPPAGFAIIVAGNIVFGALLAKEEEKQLAARYGADYTAYRTAVPSFVPRLTPVTFGPDARVEPSFRAAFLAESFTLAMALALVPIALAGQPGLLPAAIIFVVAMLLFVVASRAGRR